MTINGKLEEISPEKYSKFVQIHKGIKTIYVVMQKALYGMMMSSLLFYRHFRKDLESIGYEVNPYDKCIANRTVKGNQQTVTWHVDDTKVSHINPEVNSEFCKWCEEKYGDEENGKVKIHRGKIHDYLAMKLYYNTPNKVKIDMKSYCKEIIKEYLYTLNKNVNCPWNINLFDRKNDTKELDQRDAETFHTFVMKCMFVAKHVPYAEIGASI